MLEGYVRRLTLRQTASCWGTFLHNQQHLAMTCEYKISELTTARGAASCLLEQVSKHYAAASLNSLLNIKFDSVKLCLLQLTGMVPGRLCWPANVPRAAQPLAQLPPMLISHPQASTCCSSLPMAPPALQLMCPSPREKRLRPPLLSLPSSVRACLVTSAHITAAFEFCHNSQ